MENQDLASGASLSSRNHAADTFIDLMAGTLGGTANCLSGQPLDTVKVKMQTFPTTYKSAADCFFRTLRTDGLFKGLYAGTIPALVANIAENAVLFMSYGVCQKLVMKAVGIERMKDVKPVHKAFAGSGAAFFAALVLTPTELIKCRLQAAREMVEMGKMNKSKHYSGPTALTKHILKTEGFRGIFRGFVPTVAREMPGYFFFFGGYEMARILLTPPGGDPAKDLGPMKTVVCGGIGGVIFWTSIFPTDVIKSRAQIASGASRGFLSVGMEVVRQDGFLALYRGLGPTLLRTFISSGCLFVTYEYSKKMMEYFVY